LATGHMTYFQHLEELRRRIIVSAIALVVAFAVAWLFAWDILAILKNPAGGVTLNYMSPMEPFLVRFKLAMFGAVLLALPVILFEILSFASPALKAKERRYTIGILVMIVLFFAAGVIFGYRVIMPPGIRWLFNVAGTQMRPVLSANQYVTFMGWFMIVRDAHIHMDAGGARRGDAGATGQAVEVGGHHHPAGGLDHHSGLEPGDNDAGRDTDGHSVHTEHPAG
jgi:Tat protein translocase TatC